jgi:hypothetical protein
MRPVAIVPLFNHARTIVEVLDSIALHGLPIIVVDDGSSDDGAARVEQWTERQPMCTLVRLERNRGKARALIEGMSTARELGFTHAITLDADGQHDASRIPAFIAAAGGTSDPPRLVLGSRVPLPHSYPLARLCGRTLSGLAVRAACGRTIGDAACGMRVWPIEQTLSTPARGGRYAWEEEMIIRLAWAGVATSEVTIPVIYRPRSIGPSHYRFGRDWPEGIAVLASCVLRRCFDPRVTWDSSTGSARTLWWPLAAGPSQLHARLLALIAAIMGCLATAPWPWSDAVHVAPSILLAAVAIAAWRTRAPLFAVAAGATIGWQSTMIVSLASSIAMAAAVPALIARERLGRAQSND